jgi:hypothetical protein
VEKTCTKCKSPGPFYRSNKAKDGLTSWCRVCMKVSNKRWHDSNLERHREMNKTCYQAHKQSKHERRMARLHTDPRVRLVHNLRARLHDALGADRASTMELVGCSADRLKSHLEGQFLSGMTWNNYGAWHIDHKIPMAKIDPTDTASLRAICHYTNLQPLWAQDNLKKGSR